MALSHYLNQCWDVVNWTPRKKLQWNYNRNSSIFIQENAFQYGGWKTAAILFRPQCVKMMPHECHVIQNHWQLESSITCTAWQQRKCKRLGLLALHEGNPAVTGSFITLCVKGPLIWKVFWCYDTIMTKNKYGFMLKLVFIVLRNGCEKC